MKNVKVVAKTDGSKILCVSKTVIMVIIRARNQILAISEIEPVNNVINLAKLARKMVNANHAGKTDGSKILCVSKTVIMVIIRARNQVLAISEIEPVNNVINLAKLARKMVNANHAGKTDGSKILCVSKTVIMVIIRARNQILAISEIEPVNNVINLAKLARKMVNANHAGKTDGSKILCVSKTVIMVIIRARNQVLAISEIERVNNVINLAKLARKMVNANHVGKTDGSKILCVSKIVIMVIIRAQNQVLAISEIERVNNVINLAKLARKMVNANHAGKTDGSKILCVSNTVIMVIIRAQNQVLEISEIERVNNVDIILKKLSVYDFYRKVIDYIE